MNRAKWLSRQYEASKKGLYATLEGVDARGYLHRRLRVLWRRKLRKLGIKSLGRGATAAHSSDTRKVVGPIPTDPIGLVQEASPR